MTDIHEISGLRLAVETTGAIGIGPTIVMLHEGLGSITQWRDFPDRIHAATGLPVVAYDRSGYGRSGPGPAQYGPDFMHCEALEILPALLQNFEISQPILLGHSDGASIALIAAASDLLDPVGVITIAAHIFVEPAGLNGVRVAKERRDQIVEGMARHHHQPAIAFDRWSTIWLDPSFETFDICEILSNISCPLLVLQGDHDEYATEEMVHGIIQRVPQAVGKFISQCGHIAHKDQPDVLIEEIVSFLSMQGTTSIS